MPKEPVGNRPGNMTHQEWKAHLEELERKEVKEVKPSRRLHVDVLIDVGEICTTVRRSSKWRLTEPILGKRTGMEGETVELVRKHPTPPQTADERLGTAIVVETWYGILMHVPARLVSILDDKSCRSYLSMLDRLREHYPAKNSQPEIQPTEWVTVLTYKRID